MKNINPDLFRALYLVIFPFTLPFSIVMNTWADVKSLVNVLLYAQDGAIMSLEEEIDKKEQLLRLYKR